MCRTCSFNFERTLRVYRLLFVLIQPHGWLPHSSKGCYCCCKERTTVKQTEYGRERVLSAGGDRCAVGRRPLGDERQPPTDDDGLSTRGHVVVGGDDERSLTGVGARDAGPRQRVVLGRVQTEHVARLDGDEPIDGEVDLVEAQLHRTKRRLPDQRVLDGGVLTHATYTNVVNVGSYPP